MKTNLTLISPSNIIKDIADSGCNCSISQTIIIIVLVLECIQFLSWAASIVISIIRVNTKQKIKRIRERELELQQARLINQDAERHDQQAIGFPPPQPTVQLALPSPAQQQTPIELPVQPQRQLLIQPQSEQPIQSLLLQPQSEQPIQPQSEQPIQTALVQLQRELLLQPQIEQPIQSLLVQLQRQLLLQPQSEQPTQSQNLLLESPKKIPSLEPLVQLSNQTSHHLGNTPQIVEIL